MKHTEQWLVAVTAGRWQKHGIIEAKLAGLKVLAIDEDPDAEGFLEADAILVISFNDHSAIIKAIEKLNIPISGAISFCSEVGMIIASRIREQFNLPGPHLELCKRLLDKGLQRQIWTAKGVPGPAWQVFQNEQDLKPGLKHFNFPFIIKPTDSSGSRGVTKVESSDDDVSQAIKQAFKFSRSGKVIVESYMKGTEFTVEVFAINGHVHVLAVTEKKKVEGTRGTVARELATPTRSKEVIESIKNSVVAAFAALGYADGPGHAEVILQEDGFVGLVEVAGRGGGFMVFNKFVPAVSGVNIARLSSLQAVGRRINDFLIEENAAVLRFFPSKPGVIKEIHGFDKANKLHGVESASFVQVGERFNSAAVDGDRLGYILSCAPTPQAAQEQADKAESYIHFVIEP